MVAPILEDIDLKSFLNETIKTIAVGGESGQQARVCDFN